MPSDETSQNSVDDASHQQDNMVPDVLNNCVSEPKPDVAEEEIRGIVEVIASTGKFWHDWEKLKAMLSFQLKQVWGGETYTELVKWLDEALLTFDEGPPFTVHRLCEILLAARSIYPNLSKLALALEKNLSVTSTLSVSTDPYPQTMRNPDEPNIASEEPQLHTNSVPNGVEPVVGDRDEIMTGRGG